MFRQLNFRSFFNFLGRNKLYAAINIFGLSVSLMFVILIADNCPSPSPNSGAPSHRSSTT